MEGTTTIMETFERRHGQAAEALSITTDPKLRKVSESGRKVSTNVS